MKKLFIILSFLFVLVSCGKAQVEEVTQNTPVNSAVEEQDQTSEDVIAEQETIVITSSILPISSIVNAIGGEFVDVNNIIPAGVSPHGFDMSARQRAEIEDSELVFMTWLDHIDGFLEKSVSEDVQIHLADGMELIEIESHDHSDHEDEYDDHAEDEHDDHWDEHSDTEEHHDDEEHAEHEDDHNSDPHVWLGKDNIIVIAKKIELKLAEKLPSESEYFSNNREIFESELNAIYDEFTGNIAWKAPQEFIVFHDAYNYLFESIGLDSNFKISFSENVLHDTGTAHMKELIDEINLHGIKHIFKEPQFSDTNINTLIDEFNLWVYTLDPLGTDASADGYLTNLRNNLESLINIYE